MIFSHINAKSEFMYYPKGIQAALQFLQEHRIETLQPGSYPIDGERIYAKVFDVTTAPAETIHPEVHRLYCDVQYWESGGELFGIAPDLGGNPVFSSSEADDVILYESAAGESFVKAGPGCFAVFFPADAHRPGVCEGTPTTFRKCVIKVRTDAL